MGFKRRNGRDSRRSILRKDELLAACSLSTSSSSCDGEDHVLTYKVQQREKRQDYEERAGGANGAVRGA